MELDYENMQKNKEMNALDEIEFLSMGLTRAPHTLSMDAFFVYSHLIERSREYVKELEAGRQPSNDLAKDIGYTLADARDIFRSWAKSSRENYERPRDKGFGEVLQNMHDHFSYFFERCDAEKALGVDKSKVVYYEYDSDDLMIVADVLTGMHPEKTIHLLSRVEDDYNSMINEQFKLLRIMDKKFQEYMIALPASEHEWVSYSHEERDVESARKDLKEMRKRTELHKQHTESLAKQNELWIDILRSEDPEGIKKIKKIKKKIKEFEEESDVLESQLYPQVSVCEWKDDLRP